MNEFLRTDTAMSALSSMRTGGIAPVAYFPETEQSLCDTVRRLTEEHKRFFVFGNLSNVLLPDGTLDFVPVITTGIKTVTVTDTDDGIKVYAACGVSLTGLALEFCRRDYAGLSFAYGIPGTVGGAVFHCLRHCPSHCRMISSAEQSRDFKNKRETAWKNI